MQRQSEGFKELAGSLNFKMLNLKAWLKIERRINTCELNLAQPCLCQDGSQSLLGSCELRPWNMASGKERSRKIHSTVQFMLRGEAPC